MSAKEVGFGQRAFLEATRLEFLSFEGMDQDVALSDAHPGRAPHVEGHTVVALRDEVGCLNSLKSVGATACAYDAVAGYYVKSPDTLVIHIGRLEGAVAGIGQCYSHVVGDVGFGVNRILGFLVEEVFAAGGEQQCCQGHHIYLFHVCRRFRS